MENLGDVFGEINTEELFPHFPTENGKRRGARSNEPAAKRLRETREDTAAKRSSSFDTNGSAAASLPIDLGSDPILDFEEIVDKDGKPCKHELCLPPDWNREEFIVQLNQKKKFTETVNKPAREYPFELDPFQKVSIACLEQGHSVLVSAHTSAGKTVVAEYAIAMSLRDKQRVIYTSPLKALSNQKYRELYEVFQDVGLLTGDLSINQEASCLVMTTEILRSMLYRGSELLREVAWVIFDEIHYMKDSARGVVWEETIILLPDKVRHVFLSATIPNAKEFASWISKLHNQPCHVVYTDVRPVPLQHYVFPQGGNGLHLVVDENGDFKESGFQTALKSISPGSTSSRDSGPKDRRISGPSRKNDSNSSANKDCFKIVKTIMERNYEPVIVFIFSRSQCETMALGLAKLDFNTDAEKKLVTTVFENAIDSLSEEDKTLPQIEQILPLLKRGIGIHHSGLLPLVKEVVEILFQEGLVKCLFATETFAMGLNMPAKTVVFTSSQKYDGKSSRWLTSGEYIQMSGRAGRRGKDDRGIVILMLSEVMEPAVCRSMIQGKADSLTSSFYIGFNMLLNITRVEGVEPEELLRKSFHQYQINQSIPDMVSRLNYLVDQKNSIKIKNESKVASYYSQSIQLEKMRQGVRLIVNQPVHLVQYLVPGRLVRVKDEKEDWGWGAVVNFAAHSNQDVAKHTDPDHLWIVDVLLPVSGTNYLLNPQPNPLTSTTDTDSTNFIVFPVLFSLIYSVSSLRVFMSKDLRSMENRRTVGKEIVNTINQFPEGIPYLNPVEDMGITDPSFQKLIRKIESLEDKMGASTPQLEEQLKIYQNKIKLENEIKNLKKVIRRKDAVILKDELKAMKRVLRRLGYVNKRNVIEVKGRVACEINCNGDIVLTELIFSGYFKDLSVEQTAAALIVFGCEENPKESPRVKPELDILYQQIMDVAKRVGTVFQESKMNINVDEFLAKFKPAYMDLAFNWCKGATFSEILKGTDYFEGSIIRNFRRTEELARQLVMATKAIGNTELENKFAEVITKLKRDIIFAASLYL